MPAVNWVERGMYGDGNSVPRYHIVYGTWRPDRLRTCQPAPFQKAGCVEALLNGYANVRPLNADEKASWNLVLRGAALRFWLSRLLTRRLQQQRQQKQAGEMALQKDPAEFFNKLNKRWTVTPPAL